MSRTPKIYYNQLMYKILILLSLVFSQFSFGQNHRVEAVKNTVGHYAAKPGDWIGIIDRKGEMQTGYFKDFVLNSKFDKVIIQNKFGEETHIIINTIRPWNTNFNSQTGFMFPLPTNHSSDKSKMFNKMSELKPGQRIALYDANNLFHLGEVLSVNLKDSEIELRDFKKEKTRRIKIRKYGFKDYKSNPDKILIFNQFCRFSI